PQITKIFENSPQIIYAAFDPTAVGLHVGPLLVIYILVIMALLHCQRSSHRPIALLGGVTVLIGDPSHRKTERSQLKKSLAQRNLEAIKQQLMRIFENHEHYLWNGKLHQRPLPHRTHNECKGQVEGLVELNCGEVQQTLNSGTLVQLLAEPDITILKIEALESNHKPSLSSMPAES
uniref:Uncharacterized protein n=1 Tax=Glossina morsitans morsitans TaxID=37546 RepID=A0A1B0FME4_GLOMM